VERVGPRTSGFVAACCWGAAFVIAALAISIHNIWLLRLGYGVVGGCGLGIGYITPVPTLIKWFPDRRGLATGLFNMGGRFFWSWASDSLGRTRTYAVFFLLGPVLYATTPFADKTHSL
jgi:hypothetical protein